MEQSEVDVSAAFRCAAWRVEPERLRVVADGGHSTRLSPRAMAVLQTLAQQAPHVVRRQELMEAVWPRQSIGDGALSQAVLELRQAFGDDAREPRMIETVRAVGVRLMVPVTAADAAPAASTKPEYAPTSPNARPPETSSAAALDPATQSRPRLPLGLAVALLAAAVIMVVTLRPEPAESPGPDPSDSLVDARHTVPVLMIVPFEDVALSPGGATNSPPYFARGIADAIAVQLARSPQLRLIAERALGTFFGEGLLPRDVAAEVGADLILTGSVQRTADALRLTAQLVDAKTAEQRWAGSYRRELTDIFAVQDEVAAAVARALLISLPAASDQSPTSLSAYDRYLAGRALLARLSVVANDEAVELFRQAIAIDPTFAAAQAALAQALATRGYLFSAGDDALDEALVVAATALQLRDDLADAHYARALALAGKSRFAESLVAVGRVISLSPNHVDAQFLAGFLADSRGAVSDAMGFYRNALTLDPTLPRTSALARLMLLTGTEASAALAVSERGHQLAPGPPTLYAAHVATLAGDHQRSETLCTRALTMGVPRAANLCGCNALLAGDAARARLLLEDDVAREATPRWWGPFTYLSSATALAAALANDRSPPSTDASTAISALLDEGEGHSREQLARGNDHWAVHYNLAAVA